jgi:hypothetical protein
LQLATSITLDLQKSKSTSLTSQDIADEIGRQIQLGNLDTPQIDSRNMMYMVHMPPGVVVDGITCTTACAFHTAAFATIGIFGITKLIYFAVIPDQGPGSGCDIGCGSGTMLENIASASSHELIETVTDPDTLNGWYAGGGNCEISDRCNQLQTKILAGGVIRTVQKQWSNSRQDCIGQVDSAAVCGRGSAGVNCSLANEPDDTTFRPSSLSNGVASDANNWGSAPEYWHTIQFPDVNGDGKADYCARASDGIHCALASLSHGTASFDNDHVWIANFDDASGWNAGPYYWGTIQFADVNGDGKADVCGRGGGGIYCALSNGSGFGSASLWNGDPSDAHGWWTGPQYWATIQFPDVNGDGSADYCARGSGGIRCALSNGANAFTGDHVWRAEFGDGSWDVGPEYWGTIQFVDVNADGNDDVCGRGFSGIYCALSTGTGFGAPTLWNGDFSDANGWNAAPYYYATIRFPDVNGDGRADVCGRGGEGVYCATSNGSAFVSTALWDADPSDGNGWAGGPQYWATLQFPDVNGDGKADFCGRGGDGVRCSVSTGSSFTNNREWNTDYSDANGWAGSPSYWSTIQFPTFGRYRQPRTWRPYANGLAGGWLP